MRNCTKKLLQGETKINLLERLNMKVKYSHSRSQCEFFYKKTRNDNSSRQNTMEKGGCTLSIIFQSVTKGFEVFVFPMWHASNLMKCKYATSHQNVL